MSSMPITLFFSIFLVLQSTTNAFNITEMLSPYNQFREYNSFLTQTGVANEINNQKAVTVLVVSDDQLYYFKHLPGDVVKTILSLHVILGYYTEYKLRSLEPGTTLATLNQDDTLTVNHVTSGPVTFNSVRSSPNMGPKLLAELDDRPTSISILQISSTINTNGGGDSSTPPPSSTPPQQSPSLPPTGSTVSPPRKALAPPPTSRDKNSQTPNASLNKPSNSLPPATSSSTKGNNNAPPPSKTKPSNASSSHTPPERNSTSPPPDTSSTSKSLGPTSSNDGSPVALPLKPSSTPPPAAVSAADVQAPSSDMKNSVARISYGNYLGSILIVFTAVWFFISTSW